MTDWHRMARTSIKKPRIEAIGWYRQMNLFKGLSLFLTISLIVQWNYFILLTNAIN